ncbi:MAG: helix-turn-helix domain-containing protein [Actinomycetota bacterium]
MGAEPHSVRSDCPIAGSLDLLGDRWTLLVLRDLLIGGVHHFTDFGVDERIPPNTLTDRLQRLVEAGLIERERDASDARRWFYRPLAPAVALIPILVDLMVWGTEYTGGAAPQWILDAVATDRSQLISRLQDAASARS